MASFSAIDSALGAFHAGVLRQMAALRWHADRLTARRPLIAATLAILAILAMLATLALLNLDAGSRIGSAMAADPAADEPSEPAPVVNQLTLLNDAPPMLRTKCPECGVVESWREIVPDGSDHADTAVVQQGRTSPQNRAPQLKSYEITLRMKDGSSHRFVDANPANWRPGQRIILIGQSTPASR